MCGVSMSVTGSWTDTRDSHSGFHPVCDRGTAACYILYYVLQDQKGTSDV